MGKQTKSTEAVTPQPQPAAVEPLAIRLAGLSLEAEQISNTVEKLTRVIEGTPARIATARAAYDQGFSAADDAIMDSAREEIRAANADRDQAAAEIVRQAGPLRDMQDRQQALRSETFEVARIAGDELERAQRAVRDAHLKIDAAGHVGSKLTALIASVSQYEAPVAKPAVAPVDAPAPTKPKCPRCRRTQDVSRSGEDAWRCNAGWHGPINFRSDGQIMENQTAASAGAGRIRTSY